MKRLTGEGPDLDAEFIDAITERADAEFGGKLQQAFVAWFIEAEFGRVEWAFTDDAGDGGIDAVVWRPAERPSVVIVQSKFSERPGRAMLGMRAYEEFDEVVDAFRDDEAEFTQFLLNVRDDARRTYRKAYEKLDESGNWLIQKKAFVLITTCRRRPKALNRSLPASAYRHHDSILSLYREYRKGQTPRAKDLQLTVEDRLPYTDTHRGVTSYLFNARVSDFRRYCDDCDVGRLVARNIRFNLAGPIGREIRKTYESAPSDFWYMHNGLTVVCDGYHERAGVIRLTNPSVVNGAQTLYAIAASAKKVSTAKVATRVVVRRNARAVPQEDDAWLQGVIRGVNTQNRVKSQDFRSNEPEQLELQRLFRDQKVFYERKRGEWREHRNDHRYRGFERASLKDVALALTAVSEEDGAGVLLVKRGLEALLGGDERQYRSLFPVRSKMSRKFEKIYFAYRVAQFVRRSAYSQGNQARRQRHAYWTTVWIVHKALISGASFFSAATVDSIRQGFDRLESDERIGQRARKQIRTVAATVWRVWRAARRADPERWTANSYFKSRPAHAQIRRQALGKARKALKDLATELKE